MTALSATTITGATGGNFENLVPNLEPAVTQITDSVDTVTVTIESAGDVLENAAPTFTIKVDQKLDHDLTVTLSNGKTVTIAAGSTQTSYALPAQGDDVYKDGETIKLGITNAAVDGQTFENLVIGKEAEVNVGDTTSEVKATLTVDKTAVAEGGSVTYTVTLTNAAGMPMASHGPLEFTLTDGTDHPGERHHGFGHRHRQRRHLHRWSGCDRQQAGVGLGRELREADPRPENLTTTVTDEPSGQGDKITVTIESNGDVLENAAPTFTIKVDQKLDHDLTVTLSNGQTVVITAGALQPLTPCQSKVMTSIRTVAPSTSASAAPRLVALRWKIWSLAIRRRWLSPTPSAKSSRHSPWIKRLSRKAARSPTP